MIDIKISDMMKMQMALWENNKLKWSPMAPEYGRNSLLWMIEEVADVYMYLTDTLLR